jgi:hypothetical protein
MAEWVFCSPCTMPHGMRKQAVCWLAEIAAGCARPLMDGAGFEFQIVSIGYLPRMLPAAVSF